MIHQKKLTVWCDDAGRELIRLKDNEAYICPANCDAETLDDLAEACVAAAEALRLIEETSEA